MKRLIAPLVVAAVALTPGAAFAKAKVYKGTFQYVGADGDYVTGSFGKAQLVDGPRNDKLSVHVRRLARKATYTFRLQQAPKACAADAPGGTDVPGWKYRNGGVLRTNRKGHANGKATSRSFKATRGVEYFVGVYSAQGDLVLCAELRTKKAKSKHADKPKHDHKPKPATPESTPPKADPPGQSEDAPGHAEDKTRGKSEDAPGRAKDKTRGKSEDAPGRNKKPRR